MRDGDPEAVAAPGLRGRRMGPGLKHEVPPPRESQDPVSLSGRHRLPALRAVLHGDVSAAARQGPSRASRSLGPGFCSSRLAVFLGTLHSDSWPS